MLLSAIAAISLYSLISLSVQSRQQVVISRDYVRYNALLDSFLDYTLYGIKNRWCFDDAWMRHVGATCPLSSPFSTEAILLEPDSARSIVDYAITKNQSPPTTLGRTSMTHQLNVSTIPSTHPLYPILESFRGAGLLIKTVQFDITRVDSKVFPIRGREALLEVKVTLILPGIASFGFGGGSRISSTARVLVAPRELNYFALVVAKDLHLDVEATGANGNVYIPPASTGGIVFESPIYVNGDIYLPSSGKNPSQFLGRVHMSNASHLYLGTSSKPFSPEKAGDVSGQTFADMSTVGGFFRGFDFDDLADSGLAVLSGQTVGTADVSLAQDCLPLAKAEGDLTATRESSLLVTTKTADVTNGRYEFSLALNNLNRFVRQGYTSLNNNVAATNNVSFINKHQAVIRLKIKAKYAKYSRRDAFKAIDGDSEKNYDFELGMGTTANMDLFGQDAGAPVTMNVTLTPDPALDASMPSIANSLKLAVVLNGQNRNHIRSIAIEVQAYDLACYAGYDRRLANTGGGVISALYDGNFTRKSNIFLNTTSDTTVDPRGYPLALQAPLNAIGTPFAQASNGAQRAYPSAIDTAANIKIPPRSLSFIQYYKTCFGTAQDDHTMAFGVAKWEDESAFLDSTRNSWHFAEPGGTTVGNYPMSTLTTTLSDNTGFIVRSISGECIIPPTTKLVTGFFTCDRLTIQARTQSLTIIGTIIASGSNISAAAVAAGIRWKSIYADTATSDLIAAQALGVGSTCPVGTPIWNPEMSPSTQWTAYNCSPISLRAKANPFTWTTVTPDCGVASGTQGVSCLHHSTRFLMNELSREVVIE